MLENPEQAALLRRVGIKGRGVRRVLGQMNKLEARYAAYLEMGRIGGNLEWYAFDAIKLRLAEATFYTPDFLVMLPDGEIQCHEVKGFWEDDARVKIKVAASKFPFTFLGLRLVKGQWEAERF
jgi:hypothetical protein